MTIHLNIANDSGNGYMKEEFNNYRFRQPSVIAEVRKGKEPTPINDTENPGSVASTINDILNNQYVTIDSPGVNANGKYFVSTRAQNSTMTQIGFNIMSEQPKSDSDVGIICLLSEIAGYSLKQIYEETNELPETIKVVVDKMATALPISDFKIKSNQEKLISRFTIGSHVVMINNFETPIPVNITFKTVLVNPEGAIGQYALIGDPHEKRVIRQDGIFDDFVKENNIDAPIDGEYVQNAGKVISIDIGDYTTDISVMDGFTPFEDANQSLKMGIGSLTNYAIDDLKAKYPTVPMPKRQDFTEEVMNGKTKRADLFREELQAQMPQLVNSIISSLRETFTSLRGDAGLIVVHGGGANTTRSELEPALKALIKEVMIFEIPIMYIPEEYSQWLNLDGLSMRINNL